MLVSLALAAVLVTVGTRVSRSQPCSNVVPGLYTQSRGVDVTALDLRPIDPVSDAGFRGVVVQYTCTKGSTRVVNGKVYNQPDQVWVIQNLPTGQFVSTAKVMKTSSEAREELSINAGLSGTYNKFSFSASFSFSKIQKTLHEKARKSQYVSATFLGREAELLPPDHLTLGPVAQQAVDNLPSQYLTNPEAYKAFIKQYGTHYMTSATYGGLMQTYQETSSDYYETHTESEISAQASAGFDAILEAKGGTTTSNVQTDTEFEESTTLNIRYYGGTANLMTDKGLTEWQPTILEKPWTLSSSLTPISSLIRDPNKAGQLEIAAQDYVLYVYLDVELPRILKMLPAKVQVRPEVAELLGRINVMKSNVRPLVPEDVEKIGKETNELYVKLFTEYYNADDGLIAVHDLDREMDFVCPAGRIITHVTSTYDRHRRDRQWSIGCTFVPGLRDLLNCAWTSRYADSFGCSLYFTCPVVLVLLLMIFFFSVSLFHTDYVNNFRSPMDFTCPGGGVMKGMQSYHDNNQEDRRWKYMCCHIDGASTEGCYRLDPFNYQAAIDVDVGIWTVGGVSSVFNAGYLDRSWVFIVCPVEYYNLPV